MADAKASTLFDMRVQCPPARWTECAGPAGTADEAASRGQKGRPPPRLTGMIHEAKRPMGNARAATRAPSSPVTSATRLHWGHNGRDAKDDGQAPSPKLQGHQTCRSPPHRLRRTVAPSRERHRPNRDVGSPRTLAHRCEGRRTPARVRRQGSPPQHKPTGMRGRRPQGHSAHRRARPHGAGQSHEP